MRVNPGVLDAEAYGVKSTAADMIRFVQANNAPGQLEKSIQRAVEATHVGYFAAKQFTPPRIPSGPTLYNKTGSTNGFGVYVAFVPEKKIGVVILANVIKGSDSLVSIAKIIMGAWQRKLKTRLEETASRS